jgi:hypothetical protein
MWGQVPETYKIKSLRGVFTVAMGTLSRPYRAPPRPGGPAGGGVATDAGALAAGDDLAAEEAAIGPADDTGSGSLTSFPERQAVHVRRAGRADFSGSGYVGGGPFPGP